MISRERERIVRSFDRLHGRHPTDIEIEIWKLQELYNRNPWRPMPVDGTLTAENAKLMRGLILDLLG